MQTLGIVKRFDVLEHAQACCRQVLLLVSLARVLRATVAVVQQFFPDWSPRFDRRPQRCAD